MYKKELDECISNIELASILQQDESRAVQRQKQREMNPIDVSGSFELKNEENGAEEEEEEEEETEKKSNLSETDLALKILNDRKLILAQIITNLQEVIDTKDILTVAMASIPEILVGSQTTKTVQQTQNPSPLEAPKLLRISELDESVAINRGESDAQVSKMDGEEKERCSYFSCWLT